MVKKQYFWLIAVLFLFFTISFVSSTNCWEYESETNCDLDNTCTWKSDSWGSWCEQLNCWSLWTETDCTTTSVPNKECRWKDSSSWGWCEQTSCWSFQGTDNATCEGNSEGLNCNWNNQCTGL